MLTSPESLSQKSVMRITPAPFSLVVLLGRGIMAGLGPFSAHLGKSLGKSQQFSRNKTKEGVMHSSTKSRQIFHLIKGEHPLLTIFTSGRDPEWERARCGLEVSLQSPTLKVAELILAQPYSHCREDFGAMETFKKADESCLKSNKPLKRKKKRCKSIERLQRTLSVRL